jgi:ribonuclease HI
LPETNQGGWGLIIRDHFGQMMAAGAGATDFLMNAQHAETVACMKAIEQAAALGMERIVVETDAVNVAIALQDTTFDRSILGTMYREIRSKMMYDFTECSTSHCPRACNSVAHTLAAMSLSCTNGPCSGRTVFRTLLQF